MISNQYIGLYIKYRTSYMLYECVCAYIYTHIEREGFYYMSDVHLIQTNF